jgi:T-complex protein 1 subunit eta
MNSAFQPQIILLREGTDTSQGKSQIISNINACQAVAETIRTTLGPRGMDKLMIGKNGEMKITNDEIKIVKRALISQKQIIKLDPKQNNIFNFMIKASINWSKCYLVQKQNKYHKLYFTVQEYL